MERGEHTATIVERFAQLPAADFSEQIRDLWQCGEAYLEPTADLVESGRILPVQGLAILSAIQAQLFGYPVFHGTSVTPGELLMALRPSSRVPA